MMHKSEIIEYSLVICTHNHAAQLKTTLYALKEILHPKGAWELLIVNNACTDETDELLHNFDWTDAEVPIRIIHEPKLGISSARNKGVTEANGSYVIFLDDDETPHKSWLVEYEHAIRTWQPDALGGRIDVLFEQGERPTWLQDELLGFLGRLSYGQEAKRLKDKRTPIFTGNSAFRKSVFDSIGLFDTGLGRKGNENSGGEDTDMYRRMIKAGMDIRWVPYAVIYHRIEANKLKKSYFLDLHFRQGHMEGRLERGNQSRLPPLYLVPQLWRAFKSALTCRLQHGKDFSLRKEMNVAYFVGFISGWLRK